MQTKKEAAMRTVLVVILVLSVLVAAGDVNVVSSFSSPDQYTNGLAWDGTNLWLLGGYYDGFYEITTAGIVLSQFKPSEPGGKNGVGATFDGTNLWGMFLLNTGSPGEVYEYTTSGTFISTFTCPGTYDIGLTWDGSNLWMSCRGNQTIYEISTGGSVISSFSVPYSAPGDMAYDGTNLYFTTGNNRSIVEVTTTGTIVDTYDLSGISGSFNAMALVYDGNNFWVSDQTSDIIYEVELNTVSLNQSTFGHIKTMFSD
jgi:hypothetical protein